MKDPYADMIWKKWYDDKVSRKLKYPTTDLASLLDKRTKKFPDRIALHYLDTSITFSELNAYANKFAQFLYKAGLKQGDVVGIQSLTVPAYVIASLGIWKAGCIYCAISPLVTPREFEHYLTDSGAKLLVTMDFLVGNIGQSIAKTKLKTLVVTGLSDFLPNAAEIPDSTLKQISDIPVIRFTDIMKENYDQVIDVKIDPESICQIQYTGGTTGLPKGAMITHKNHIDMLTIWEIWLDFKYGKELIISPFPFFHVAGHFINVISQFVAMTQVLIPNPRDMDFLVSALSKYKPEHVIAVPTLIFELLKKPAFLEVDFSNLRECCCGAAPFPVEYMPEVEKVIGKNKLKEIYGMTETIGTLTGQPPLKTKFGAAGVPIIDTYIKIVDQETKQPVPLGEVGEIAAKGPQVALKGYLNQPEETANAFRDGWLYTGDLGRMDEDGFIFIVDRLKEMVNISGMKVFTREVDEVLVKHPDIQFAASVGIPDPNRPSSERVAAAIILQPGVDKDEKEKEKILAYLREQLAPYKVPKVIEFMDQLPTSAVGKILKKELKPMLSALYDGK